MSTTVPAYETFALTGEELRDAVVRFASNPIYLDNEEWENDDNPYRRQLRPQVLRYLDFGTPLKDRGEAIEYSSLAAHRILTSIYESDMMFLPRSGFDRVREDFDGFYSPSNRALGEQIRPAMERFCFGFLDDEVDVSGHWDRDALIAYLEQAADDTTTSASEAAILGSADPERAARMWLVQFAPDFLSEASAMARNTLGCYGAGQSEWFKIVIDEYGNGVHSAKHSTLFENTLASVGLRTDLHHYWQYYLVSSLMSNNYFHYLGKNHELFFRYLGALYYTESTLVAFCRSAVSTLEQVFGDEVDATYFSEHVHIDTHHGRMALEKLILPIVDACGEAVIPEIVRGLEEYRTIAEIADRDFAAQIAWMDGGPANKELHDPVWAALEQGRVTAPVAHIVEPRGELSNTHSHDGDELCHIVSGTMKFVSGLGSHQILEAGQGTVIHHNRLHGAIIESEECVYEIHSIGDVRACLS